MLILFNHNIKMNTQETINYTPIGVFRSQYTPETGAPRQGILQTDNSGEIEISAPYRSALKTLNLFEYIIVIYHLDRVESWDSRLSPPASNQKHNFGLFATRSPKRPNSIGFAVVKLEKIENGTLYVSGIDAFDNTPVLDVKPYLPSIDCIESKQNKEAEQELGHHDEDFITDSKYFK